MFDLTGFQRDLLYVIAGHDQPSGQSVARELENYVSNVNHGRLYPNLDELVERSYVEKGRIDQRTNCYMITEKGEDTIRTRERWEEQQLGDQIEL